MDASRGKPTTPLGSDYRQSVAPSRAIEALGYDPVPVTSSETFRFGGWAAGLCGCGVHCVPNCCMVFWCPCVSLAQISARVGAASFRAALLGYCAAVTALCVSASLAAYASYDTHSAWLTVYRVLAVATSAAAVAFVWHLRAKIRARFDIPGSCGGDCCASVCCTCCVVAQMATHVKSYTPGSCDFGPPDILPAYLQREQTTVADRA